MNVQAISSVSYAPKLAGNMRNVENNGIQSYPQINETMSKDAAKALQNQSMISFGQKKHNGNGLRNAAIGGMMITAVGVGSPLLQSCDKDDFFRVEASTESHSSAFAKAWRCCDNKPIHDTIYIERPGKSDTVYVVEYYPVYFDNGLPFAINDSIKHQIDNVGGEIKGDTDYNSLLNDSNAITIGFTAINRYDRISYVAEADKSLTNAKQQGFLVKVRDEYIDDEPQEYWMRIVARDAGDGILYKKYVLQKEDKPTEYDEENWNDAGAVKVTNLRNGKNKVTQYDNHGNKLSAEYVKDTDNGKGNVLYSAYVIDPATGEFKRDGNGQYYKTNYKYTDVTGYVKHYQPTDKDGNTMEWPY